jgi:hypothetical protein
MYIADSLAEDRTKKDKVVQAVFDWFAQKALGLKRADDEKLQKLEQQAREIEPGLCPNPFLVDFN